MWEVGDVLYAVLYVRVSCFVVRGCAVSRRYIDVCNCDVLSVVNVYFDYLKLCVVCIYSRRHICCGECNVVSNGYDGCVCLRGLCSHAVTLGLSTDVYAPYIKAVAAVTVMCLLLFV